MENVLLIFFWISLAILFYCYLGYGLLLLLLTSMKQLVMPRKKEALSEYDIPVTLIITAYNEELILEQN
ncbi:MAG: hypothetical protein IPO53_13995 [Chitinophagaceae bacterium]|nr:hypothetical protein [Chitinophagaceae bacterium]